ncbi:DUF7511 domain-containing protein [Natrononativus amylolyticus]|uniref:DUF7511 domain-containing protein n=1 Tax=Natrononativus amylolyticus TaxID=2963434 RepID=UPI0020CC54B1|nr:hypothetical protein [Natrononativus amylolyticus]
MSYSVDSTTDRTDTEQPTFELDHITVENDDAPNECAVFPREATEEELMTHWITAHEGSFVDLGAMR